MNKDILNETIQFIFNKKEDLQEELNDIIYKDLRTPCKQTFSKLNCYEIEKVDNLRKKIFDCYELIEKLENFKKED